MSQLLFPTIGHERSTSFVSLAATFQQLSKTIGLDPQIVNCVVNNKPIHVLNMGMGVESCAILKRWIDDVSSRPESLESLDQLLVLSAQTGEETQQTKSLMESHILPDMRSHQIRYIQVAKSGLSVRDGYTVLSDTREPEICHIEGDYRLFRDNMNRAATSVRLGRPHTCAMRWKGEPLDNALGDLVFEVVYLWNLLRLINLSYVVRIGPAIARTALCDLAHQTYYGPHLGYAVGEESRMKKCDEYHSRGEEFLFPLADWGWTREHCLVYLQAQYGVTWRKSACAQCPFASRATVAQRWADDDANAIHALWTELLALAANPAMHLFSFGKAYDLAFDLRRRDLINQVEAIANSCGWAIYKVERVYTVSASGRKNADRRITRVSEVYPTVDDCYMPLLSIGLEHSKLVEMDVADWRLYRVWEHSKDKSRLVDPGDTTTESFWVTAPAIIRDKVAHPKSFSRKWVAAHGADWALSYQPLLSA